MNQMVIQVNKEGGDAVASLADIALKVGGIANLQKVNQILGSVKVIEGLGTVQEPIKPSEGPRIITLPSPVRPTFNPAEEKPCSE